MSYISTAVGAALPGEGRPARCGSGSLGSPHLPPESSPRSTASFQFFTESSEGRSSLEPSYLVLQF